MKKIAFVLIILFCTLYVAGQDISGKWNGLLSAAGTELRVDFNIAAKDGGYTATLDSPDQNAYGIPVTTIEYKKPELTITITDLGIVYKATLKEKNLFEGTFTQMGQSFPMNLKRKVE